MSLITELRRIMDMPNPNDEADRKLTKCFMLVNGEIRYVTEYLHEKGGLTYYDHKVDKKVSVVVKTLDVFLPEAGVYKCEDTYIYVTKKPMRQWQRSISEGFYSVEDFITGSGRMTTDVVSKIYKGKKVDIWVSPNAKLYYKNHNVGYVKDENTFICTSKHFKQELLDWSRDV